MVESLPNKDSKRQQFIVSSAQNPVEILSTARNKEKGCLEAIKFLRQVKEEIMNDNSYSIEGPDSDYAKFHRNKNGENEHWEGLFGILKRIGYSKLDIQTVLMDDLPSSIDERSRSEVTKAYLKLTEVALNTIYGTE